MVSIKSSDAKIPITPIFQVSRYKNIIDLFQCDEAGKDTRTIQYLWSNEK